MLRNFGTLTTYEDKEVGPKTYSKRPIEDLYGLLHDNAWIPDEGILLTKRRAMFRFP